MKVIFNKQRIKRIAVYIGVTVPYMFMLKTIESNISNWQSIAICFGLFICIDLVCWGLKK